MSAGATAKPGRVKLTRRSTGPALNFGVSRDGNGEGSPLREAVIGWSIFAVVVTVCVSLALWGATRAGWIGA